MNSWAEFYKNRVNNKNYENYFKKKYSPFLRYLDHHISNKKNCLEMGCGTSLVTKTIFRKNINFHTYDNNKEMITLTKQNIKTTIIKLHDIKRPINRFFDVVYSHGVLEHFSKEEIRNIIKTQIKYSGHLVHYVPSNLYKHPSYGDELLISKEEWKRLAKPDSIIEFNNGFDLILIWKQK